MDKLSKKELQDLVSKQQGDLSRYKARLTDLVAAHKSLLKEKETLELTITTYNNAKNITSTKKDDEDKSEVESNAVSKVEKQVKYENETTGQLKNQLETLMNSLATLSEEKSRMEASFQADKRQLRNEKMQLESCIRNLQTRLEQESKAHFIELDNLKAKLIVERHQREKEHNDHGVMIRELQKLFAEERGKREKAESLAERLRGEVGGVKEAREEEERRVRDLAAKLDEAEARLAETRHTSKLLNSRLHEELDQLKQHHVALTKKEQERASEAEERAKRLAATHEERVANLEARLTELSQTVGNYDRLRQNDQMAIDRLKERLLQLEMEHGEEKGDPSVDELINKLFHVKNLLLVANQYSEKPIDIRALLLENLHDNKNVSLNGHQLCQEEYDKLRQELDHCKKLLHSQQHPSSMRAEMNCEVDHLKSQVGVLKDRVRGLHDQIELMEQEHKKELEDSHQKLLKERCKCKEHLAEVESEWRGRVAVLEAALSKQRERALALVTEKEHEISLLKESFHNLIPQPRAFSPHRELEYVGVDGEASSSECSSKEIVRGGPTMLHYRQEIARRDVELTRLRKENMSLEAALREAQRNVAIHSAKHSDLTEALQKQVERFERCQSREGANLEYLKNVVLSFLLSNDTSCKSHMLNAIAAVLKFTESERTKIAQHSWWYNRIA